MSEDSAMWMFLSIGAICFTWFKVASLPDRKEAARAREMRFLFDGKPVNGRLELTVDGRTSHYDLVDGRVV